jgi:capsular polysaccharide biosynthesis protein
MGLVIGSMISAASGNSDFSVPDSFFSVVVAFGSGIAIGLGVAMAVLWLDKKFFNAK